MSDETIKESPEAQEDPRIALAREDEKAAMLVFQNGYLQDRCVRLNAEVRAREELIQELHRTIAGLQDRLDLAAAAD
jgi:hypothetical protein